ncbi:retinol dehydrogenase 7-like [Asterias amurensis]|uniref:retinol dehydrogenase 7-like n=1 Tax=Asterias amurensis TaxID=7602 RepID=UPI003AB75EB1
MASWLVIIALVVIIALIIQDIMDRVYKDVTYKYILVTGCDSGFGNLLSRYLGQKRGCHVIAACLSESGLEALEREAPKGTVTGIVMDVTDTESIRRARDRVATIVGDKGLWGLVNNAGIAGIPVPYHWTEKREIQRVLDVNLMGTIEVTNEFFPLIRQAKGRIVNVSSAAAVMPTAIGGYSISKLGVEAFSDALRVSCRAFGVTVHILEPGFFQTNIVARDSTLTSVTNVWNRLPKQEKAVYGPKYLDKLLSKVEMVLDRCSPSCHLVTDAMEHALCARWPWRRYMPGNDIKFIYKPLSMIPPWITDYIRYWQVPRPERHN